MDRSDVIRKRKDYFHSVLKATGLNTMVALAKAVNVTSPTLANIQSANRSASRELVLKISQLAREVEGSDILSAEAFDTVVESIPEAPLLLPQQVDQIYDGQTRNLREVDEAKNIENIRRNFEAMDNGDVFVYLTVATLPEEMGLYDTKLKQAIANAIQRGAYFVYVTPTKEYLQEIDTVVDFPGLFASFKNKVMLNISNRKGIQNEYHQRLLHIQTEPLFPLSDSKWELYLSDKFEDSHPYNAAAGAFMVARPASNNPRPSVLVPLSVPATKSFIVGMAKVVANLDLSISGEIPDVVIERLRKSVALTKKT